MDIGLPKAPLNNRFLATFTRSLDHLIWTHALSSWLPLQNSLAPWAILSASNVPSPLSLKPGNSTSIVGDLGSSEKMYASFGLCSHFTTWFFNILIGHNTIIQNCNARYTHFNNVTYSIHVSLFFIDDAVNPFKSLSSGDSEFRSM